jgi:hypothetical protein
MCLAIAPNTQCSHNLFARVWRRVAATPLRLFSFGAIVHLLVGTTILIYSHITDTQINTNVLLSGFSYGVLALPVFGFLMTWLPRACSLSPVHYGRYNSVYLLIMISLIIIEYGSIYSHRWSDLGILLLIPGWLIAMQGLWNLHIWMSSSVKDFSRVLLMLLFLNYAILIFSILAQSIDFSMPAIMPLLSIFLIWPIVLLITVFLVIKAPYSGRKITI